MTEGDRKPTYGYRIDLAYDGSAFRGFARQPTVRTVQDELEKVLAVVLRETVVTTCAGRTDAGVHARRQVVSMNLSNPIDNQEGVKRSVNKMLPPDMAVEYLRSVPEGWSARFCALWRVYRYFVRTHPVADPLRRHVVWHLGRSLDRGAMNEAAAHLVGTHDFASFCRAAPGRSTVRKVLGASWTQTSPQELQLEIVASAFCHQMVRSLVGWCVEVGLGRRSAAETPQVLEARSRQAAGRVAPPEGLILWEVGYSQEPVPTVSQAKGDDPDNQRSEGEGTKSKGGGQS